MKKNIFLIIGIVLAVVACSKQSDKTEPEPTGLTGTKWKLQGILDIQTDVLQILEPTDCEKCYTLEFDTDSTASGYSAVLSIFINIRMEGSGLVEEISESPGDGDMFRAVIAWKKSFLISEDNLELRIICYKYGKDEKHLIYKRIKS
jgi:hypothetical protein